ncbi:MAG: helix-turn-helix domain-containing protein [Rhodospirillaceae bacterium]|nr:helix-turn-helix domain-containing protein [Rhodospirillaceae bacterium]
MTEESVYLTPLEAARILGLSVKTLARYRMKAKGPVFVKFEGRVRYLRKDVDDWAHRRRRVSTMDDGTLLPGSTP